MSMNAALTHVRIYTTNTQMQTIIENHKSNLVPKPGLFDKLHFLSKNRIQMFACSVPLLCEQRGIKARVLTPDRQGLHLWVPCPAPERLSRKVCHSWRCGSVGHSWRCGSVAGHCLVRVQGPGLDPQHRQKHKSSKNCFMNFSLVLSTLAFYCCKNQTTRASFSLQVKTQGWAAAGAHTHTRSPN